MFWSTAYGRGLLGFKMVLIQLKSYDEPAASLVSRLSNAYVRDEFYIVFVARSLYLSDYYFPLWRMQHGDAVVVCTSARLCDLRGMVSGPRAACSGSIDLESSRGWLDVCCHSDIGLRNAYYSLDISVSVSVL